jgi:hypothetical protein
LVGADELARGGKPPEALANRYDVQRRVEQSWVVVRFQQLGQVRGAAAGAPTRAAED